MNSLRRLRISEQTANYLIEGLSAGKWGGSLPGVNRLAAELDVSRETVRAALHQLETQGILSSRGHGRSRVISGPGNRSASIRSVRVVVLLHDRLVDENGSMQALLFQLQRALEVAGHTCIFSTKCQVELRKDVSAIAGFVGKTRADAWVVLGGSLELLQWFSTQPVPVIAIGGRSRSVPIASVGVATENAFTESIHALHALGHRRIVFITPNEWRRPPLAGLIRTFTTELAARGILPSSYHVPDWEETPDGIRALLASLFHLTPPTALIIEDPKWTVAVLAFLAGRGLRVPAHVSLVCSTLEPSLTWHYPALAHFRWNSELRLRRIVRWVNAVRRGRQDRKLVIFPAEFERGGSIGPTPE